MVFLNRYANYDILLFLHAQPPPEMAKNPRNRLRNRLQWGVFGYVLEQVVLKLGDGVTG